MGILSIEHFNWLCCVLFFSELYLMAIANGPVGFILHYRSEGEDPVGGQTGTKPEKFYIDGITAKGHFTVNELLKTILLGVENPEVEAALSKYSRLVSGAAVELELHDPITGPNGGKKMDGSLDLTDFLNKKRPKPVYENPLTYGADILAVIAKKSNSAAAHNRALRPSGTEAKAEPSFSVRYIVDHVEVLITGFKAHRGLTVARVLEMIHFGTVTKEAAEFEEKNQKHVSALHAHLDQHIAGEKKTHAFSKLHRMKPDGTIEEAPLEKTQEILELLESDANHKPVVVGGETFHSAIFVAMENKTPKEGKVPHNPLGRTHAQPKKEDAKPKKEDQIVA